MKPAVQPAWLTLKGASLYSGLSVRTLERHIAAGSFKSRRVQPAVTSKSRASRKTQAGRRLINRESLDQWIDGAPVGEGGLQ